MLKALIRKDWKSLGTMFFQNTKNGKKRSRGSVIGLAVLYAFTYLMMAGLTLMMCFLTGMDLGFFTGDLAEGCLEFMSALLELGTDRPVFFRYEGFDLLLAVADHL